MFGTPPPHNCVQRKPTVVAHIITAVMLACRRGGKSGACGVVKLGGKCGSNWLTMASTMVKA